MRPVAKGARGLYPINIPVNTLTAYRNAARGTAIWTFNTQAVIDLWSANPTAWEIVNGLLMYNTYTAKKKSRDYLLMDSGHGVLETQLSSADKGYKAATPILVGRIGKICSYCEQVLPDNVELEHCIPKDAFPYFWITWDNFLLSCGACNTNGTGKGTGPSRATVKGWIGGNPGEVTMYNRVRAAYVWPDIDQNAYQLLTPSLWYRDIHNVPPKWRQLDDAASVGIDVALGAVDPQTRDVHATLKVGVHAAQDYEVAVNHNPTNQAAIDSVEYYGLDKSGTASASVRDTRQYNRTIEWITAVETLRDIQGATALTYANELRRLLLFLRGRGHFSVWARVASLLIGDATPVPGGGVGATIVKDILNGANVATTWPGTDLTQVP
jgi:hypothetical protein